MNGGEWLKIAQRARRGILAAGVGAVLCLVICLALTGLMSGLVSEVLVSQQKQNAVARLSEARARLEGKIAEIVALGESLRPFIGLNPDLTQEQLERIGSALVETNNSIAIVGLAPDNRLSLIYPYIENQQALGLDYRTSESQWASVSKAMRTGASVVSGPLQLVQGWRALVIRIPVFLNTPANDMSERPDYWGVATLVVRESDLLAAARIDRVMSEFDVALFASPDGVKPDELIYGAAEVADKDSVHLPVEVAGGNQWLMVAHPKSGWLPDRFVVLMVTFAGTILSLLFSSLVFLLLHEMRKVWGMALHDSLTGLANRRLLEDRMQQLAFQAERTGKGFEFFYLDLDGFKPVNDTHGHAIGDAVLIEVGSRIKELIRRGDTVARVGGDEFIILAPGKMSDDERAQFIGRVEKAISEPISIGAVRMSMAASVGFASYPSEARTSDELHKLADGRMYAQKVRRQSKYPPEKPPVAISPMEPVGRLAQG